MSSAICFNVNQSNILLSSNGLRTHYLLHVVVQYHLQCFGETEENIVEKGEIARYEQFLFFSAIFSYVSILKKLKLIMTFDILHGSFYGIFAKVIN